MPCRSGIQPKNYRSEFQQLTRLLCGLMKQYENSEVIQDHLEISEELGEWWEEHKVNDEINELKDESHELYRKIGKIGVTLTKLSSEIIEEPRDSKLNEIRKLKKEREVLENKKRQIDTKIRLKSK